MGGSWCLRPKRAGLQGLSGDVKATEAECWPAWVLEEWTGTAPAGRGEETWEKVASQSPFQERGVSCLVPQRDHVRRGEAEGAGGT